MGLIDKLEDIRRKPEEVRRKYVYGAVLVSMFFIVIIWLFSLKESMRSFSGESNDFQSIKEQFDDLKPVDLPTMENILPETKQPTQEGALTPSNQ